jgi:hypothetical protein
MKRGSVSLPYVSVRGADVSLIRLRPALEAMPGHDLEWSIFEFDGIGIAPSGMRMDEFEQLIRESRTGYRSTHPDLLSFAGGIEQVWDCIIVAATSIDALDKADLVADDYRGCAVVVDMCDSSEWRFGVEPDILSPTELQQRIDELLTKARS